MIDVIVMQWEREENCMEMSFGRKDREERKLKGEFIIIIGSILFFRDGEES